MVHKWLKKGALVEVYADNEWWDAKCILFNKNFVRVHYVGGHEDEDEWLAMDSDRIRQHSGEDPAAEVHDEHDAMEYEAQISASKEGSRKASGSSVLKTPKGSAERNPKVKLRHAQEYADGLAGGGATATGESSSRKKKESKSVGAPGPSSSSSSSSKKAKRKPDEDSDGEPPLEAIPQRAKTARPFEKAYLREVDAVWHHEKFGKVLAAVARKGLLHEDMHGEIPPTAFLAHLVATVQQAMDVHLGRHAVVAKKRSMEKIPHHLFRDFRANGSLLVIIEETLKYMRDENIREVEQLQQLVFCQEDEDEFSHMNLLLQIREALLNSEFLVRPVLFFSSTLQRGKHGKERMEECQKWADALGAHVTDEQEHATHFLIADTADMAETEEFFCRQVDQHHPQKKHTPDLAYVHWWFFPDSYDDWVPQLEVEGDYAHQEQRKSKWTVCLRWLRDSFKFNEWMNELDYEPDEDAPTAQGRFTAEEDATIWQAYQKVGKNYDEIRKCPGLGARSSNSIQGRLKILLKRAEGGEDPLAAPEREGSKKKRCSGTQDRTRGPGGEGSARKGKHESSAGCWDGRKGAVRKSAVKKVFRRVLTARHECWDDEVDLEASFAADPDIFCWDLPLCGEDDEDNSDSDQASQHTSNGGKVGDDSGGCHVGVSNAVLMKNIAGGALPLVLPAKASWFDSESVHDIEKAALPEYFDAKHERHGKTSQSYIWHRQAIISQWHLHVAAHIARLFRSSRQEDGGGKEAGSEGIMQGRKRHAKDLGAMGIKRRRSEGCSQRQSPASAGAADVTDGDEEGQDGDGEGLSFQWPPAMPVSVCLQAISGHSTDILRIFDFLESCAIINPPVDGEHETGGVWTERDLTQLCEAFRQHGVHWPAVAAQVGRAGAPEECAVVMAGVVLRRSPLQRLASLHAARLLRGMPPAIGEAGDGDTTEKARTKSADILGLASVVHRGIGWQAAAAAVDAAIHHSLADKVKTRKAPEAPKPEKSDKSDAAGSVTPMTGSEMQRLQEEACKATILAKLSLRSSLLAQRETCDMRRVMAEAVELQLERIQGKVAEMLGNQLLISTLSLAK